VSHRRQGGAPSLLSARLALGATAILFTDAREAPAAGVLSGGSNGGLLTIARMNVVPTTINNPRNTGK
jgi:hypothetical protein